MAYADPQSVTVGGTAVSLPRTASGVNTGGFSAADANTKLTVSHQYGKRTRRQVRLDLKKIAPDPLISSTNILYSMSAYLVVDTPVTGYTNAEVVNAIKALTDWLTASTNANATKLVGGEN